MTCRKKILGQHIVTFYAYCKTYIYVKIKKNLEQHIIQFVNTSLCNTYHIYVKIKCSRNTFFYKSFLDRTKVF